MGKSAPQPLMGEQDWRFSVFGHVGQTLLRIVRIHGQVGTSCFEYTCSSLAWLAMLGLHCTSAVSVAAKMQSSAYRLQMTPKIPQLVVLLHETVSL